MNVPMKRQYLILLDEKSQCISHSKTWIDYLDLTANDMKKTFSENSINILNLPPIPNLDIIYNSLKNYTCIETTSNETKKKDNNSFNMSSK